MEANKLKELKLLCANVRIDILEMLMKFGQGHLGGSMSCVELFAVLYGKQLNVDPKNPKKEDRDQVVLSKGHAGPVWYSTLAERGFFPKDWLFTLNQGGTLLPSHPDRTKTPGVDMTTGSLGQGTSTAAGIATAMKKRGLNSYTYLIVGDGELNEGQCWEAFQYIANYKLNNCIVIIDDNKRQLDGYTKDVINPFSYQEKMKAFGFYTLTAKGDDLEAIDDTINKLKEVKDSAVCMVLDSVKGQGVKFFEELLSNHSVKFNEEYTNEANKAIAQLKEYIAKEGE
ncbi:MAG: transketolase [Erysipelotrichaceae bacterium]|nr:transketolase [Erysipelotrichaceae bacterium]MDY5727367.1 transketolase [Erysipelotrichaceae bacterium]